MKRDAHLTTLSSNKTLQLHEVQSQARVPRAVMQGTDLVGHTKDSDVQQTSGYKSGMREDAREA